MMKIMPELNNKLKPHSEKGREQLRELSRRKRLLISLEKFMGIQAVISQLKEWNI